MRLIGDVGGVPLRQVSISLLVFLRKVLLTVQLEGGGRRGGGGGGGSITCTTCYLYTGLTVAGKVTILRSKVNHTPSD